MIAAVKEHAARKLPGLAHEGDPTPAGCLVLFALELAGASHATGPFEIPELGIEVHGEGVKRVSEHEKTDGGIVALRVAADVPCPKAGEPLLHEDDAR